MARRGSVRPPAGDPVAGPAPDHASMLAVYDLAAGPSAGYGPQDAAVDTSPPARPGHRRLWMAGLATVLTAGALTAIVAHNPGVPPAPATQIPKVVNTVANAIPGADAVTNLGSAPVTRLALGRRGVYVLQPEAGRIGRFDAGALSVEDFASVPPGATWIRLDDPAALMWVVFARPNDTLVRAYQLDDSEGTLQSTPFLEVAMAGHVQRAAAVDGRLWVINEAGLRYLQPVGPTLRAGSLPVAHATTLAADQTRNRLLVTTEAGSTTSLFAVDTSTAVARPARRLATVALKTVSIALAGDDLWLSGLAAAGPAITRLDPVSGRVVVSPRSGSLTASGSLRAGGSVLWWRSTDGLRCLDADRGTVVDAWPKVDGPVVSAVGYIYVVVGGVLQRLASTGRCLG